MTWHSAGTWNILDIFLVSSLIFPKFVPLMLLDEITKLLRLLELDELICFYLEGVVIWPYRFLVVVG